jgi:hypothetical protein
MPLIVLPSTPTTEKASAYLTSLAIDHQVIPIPASLNYQTGSDVGIYVTATVYASHGDVSMLLTKQRFVVMRVFKSFVLPAN